MAERHPNYMAIFYLLCILTAVEIGFTYLSYLSFTKLTINVLLVAAALGKASIVALYFMHLRFEVKTLSVIAFTPLAICAFLVFMLLPDLGGVPHKTAATLAGQMPKTH